MNAWDWSNLWSLCLTMRLFIIFICYANYSGMFAAPNIQMYMVLAGSFMHLMVFDHTTTHLQWTVDILFQFESGPKFTNMRLHIHRQLINIVPFPFVFEYLLQLNVNCHTCKKHLHLNSIVRIFHNEMFILFPAVKRNRIELSSLISWHSNGSSTMLTMYVLIYLFCFHINFILFVWSNCIFIIIIINMIIFIIAKHSRMHGCDAQYAPCRF